MATKLDRQIFRSPLTHESLSEENPKLWVSEKGAKFPVLDGVPVLLPDSRLALADFKMRALALIQHYERNVAELKQDLKKSDLLPLTRSRLEKTRDIQIQHLQFLQNILEPVKPTAKTPDQAAPEFGYTLPQSQPLQGYFPNLVRDWSTQTRENEAHFDIVKALLGDSRPKQTAVLGSGAGRLAYDFHQLGFSQSTICCDLNPLLTFAAKRITSGETLKVAEFPIAPKDVASAPGLIRECRAPKAAREGLHYVIADVYYLPFAEKSFDLVVTPWLVDIVPHKFEFIISEINRILKPNGVWLNTGSFNFRLASWSDCISVEEAIEKIEMTGFKCESKRQDLLPYLHSDLDAHQRNEVVTSFTVRKIQDSSRAVVAPVKPSWLLNPQLPVPHTQGVASLFTTLESQAFLLSAIDGKRSALEISALVHQRYGLSPEDAAEATLNFLMRVEESLIFKTGF